MIKGIYEKKSVDVIVNNQRLGAFALRWATKQGYMSLPPSFDIVLEILAMAITQEKEINDIQAGKQEVQLSKFIDFMIMYILKILWSH